jgi:hypothetical protein
MIDDIIQKGTEWIERWQEVTFTPTTLFHRARFALDSSTFLFAVGCLFAGYVFATISSVFYFTHFYFKNVAAHIVPEKLKGTIEGLSLIAGVYILAVLVALLLTSSVSYLVYRWFGSQRSFNVHFAAEMHLLNLEPVAAVALVVFFENMKNNHHLIGNVSFVVFSVTRCYYVLLAYIALREVHRLSSPRRQLAFALGYIPPTLVSIGFQLLIVNFLGQVFTGVID